jgi:biotin carboxyl carrier protein
MSTKQLRVTVEGKTYDVTVELLDDGGAKAPPPGKPARGAVRSASVDTPVQAAPKPKAAPASEDGSVLSPLAGKVVSIDVEVGAEVEEGDQLMTLEAMKMNTMVYAPTGGTLAKVLVEEGSAVEEGQPLLVIN